MRTTTAPTDIDTLRNALAAEQSKLADLQAELFDLPGLQEAAREVGDGAEARRLRDREEDVRLLLPIQKPIVLRAKVAHLSALAAVDRERCRIAQEEAEALLPAAHERMQAAEAEWYAARETLLRISDTAKFGPGPEPVQEQAREASKELAMLEFKTKEVAEGRAATLKWAELNASGGR